MRLLVVEDAAYVRDRLVSAIAQLEGIETISQASKVSQAIHQFRSVRPDVVTLDIRPSEGSGIEVLETIKRESPLTVVIMFTNLSTPLYRDRCAGAGANYFFAKGEDFRGLLRLLSSMARIPRGKSSRPATVAKSIAGKTSGRVVTRRILKPRAGTLEMLPLEAR